MHRAVDLLVVENVAHVLPDRGVAADPELAEHARAGVGVERADQKVLAGRRRGVDDAAALEAQPHALRLVALVLGRELGVGDHALGGVFDRSVEDLASREIEVPVVDLALAAGDPEPKIGALGDDAHLLGPVEALGDPLHLPSFRVPVEEARAEDELLVLGQRHPGVLRAGGGRVLADHPGDLERAAAPCRRLVPLAKRRLASSLAPFLVTQVGDGGSRDGGSTEPQTTDTGLGAHLCSVL